ncbi:ATP-binding protein [Amycolatopsis alba]|uniref:NB-ARC domain-containing protein n=1 Tax=Amycolatopsis alba DSM 44262 TaxID=1125972 RepID=A0A229RFR6_AMYAL|nr:tetratricopeptide repeat protein [Amycolatopsis alba]OXM45234.1 hypothetical protein CFP75_32110 [Amycolatopsis alba DSM 44262]
MAERAEATGSSSRSPVSNHVDTVHGTVVQIGSVHGGLHLGQAPMPPRQLPLPGSRLIGRRPQLAELEKIANGGIVLLTGMAGVGKTALAVRWARDSIAQFPDGQLYVDLRGYGPGGPLDPHDVLGEFLRAFGWVHADQAVTTSERIGAFRTLTAERRLLVLLDNASSISQILPLLPGGNACTVLVTSRAVLTELAVHHEVSTLRVKPLTEAQGSELLTDTVAGSKVADRTKLLRACGGLPLAIRIAGVRLAARPGVPADQDLLSFLDAGGGESSAVRKIFSWSYRGLTEDEAAAFRVLGVHPGNQIEPSALAAAVDRPLSDGADLLQALARANLMFETSPNRYETHDLLRAYAAELASDDRIATLTRLYDFYLRVADYADDLVSPLRFRIERRQPPLYGPLFADRVAALSWLDANLPTLTALCGPGDHVHDEYRWRMAFAVRGYFYFTKRLDVWVATHTCAVAATERLGDRWAEATTRTNLGMALVIKDDLEAAESHYRFALGVFTELGDSRSQAGSFANLAAVLRRRGELQEALRHQHEALTHYRRIGAGRHVAITLRVMASVETDLQLFSQARRHVEEAIDLALGHELHFEAAQAFNSLGIIQLRKGELVGAEIAHRTAVGYSILAASKHEEATTYHRLGVLARADGDSDRAKHWWHSAARLFREIGSASADIVAADLAAMTDEQP